MQVPLVILSATLALVQPPPADGPQPTLPPGTVIVERCTVGVAEDPIISAEVDGVLVALPAKEGNRVSTNDVLAQIDDRQAQLNVKAAEAKLAVANKTANSDIQQKYARKGWEVARAEYDAAVEANNTHEKAFTTIEMKKLYLTVEQSVLGYQKAEMDQEIAKLDVKVAQAQVDAAAETVSRHKIKSLIDNAEVVEVFKDLGEWVKAGDPVLRLVQMNPMHVEGYVRLSQAKRSEINMGQTVQVHVDELEQPVLAKITFVSPETIPTKRRITHDAAGRRLPGIGREVSDGEYKIRAEVENEDLGNGLWRLYDGLSATIVFQKQPRR